MIRASHTDCDANRFLLYITKGLDSPVKSIDQENIIGPFSFASPTPMDRFTVPQVKRASKHLRSI
jgi:hypothetical protein